MARLQIDANLDGDAMLPGGRSVAHRWTLVLTPEDLDKLTKNEPVKIDTALPNLTVRHAFITVAVGA